MLKGKSLVDMAKALEDLKQNAKDYVVPVEMAKMEVAAPERAKEPEAVIAPQPTPLLTFPGADGSRVIVEPNTHAHQQVAAYTDIPRGYYERLKQENPVLLARNVNHGFHHAREMEVLQARREGKQVRPAARLVRTHRGIARAFLSSRYRILDSYDMLDTVLPVLLDKKFEVVSSEMTEKRVYIKAVTKRVQGEVKRGDVVQFGLVISSSDVGAGSIRIEPLIYRLVCLNGAIMDSAIRKFHIGKDIAEENVRELLTDETRELSDAAFWAQVRDVVLGSMSPEIFQAEVDKLRIAANEPIKNFDLPRVVELTTKAIGISNSKYNQNSIVNYLANGADGAGLTKWGLMNAVTWAAQQEHLEGKYDESVEMERAATKLLELPKREWERIAATPKE